MEKSKEKLGSSKSPMEEREKSIFLFFHELNGSGEGESRSKGKGKV